MKQVLYSPDAPAGGPADDEYRLAEPEPNPAAAPVPTATSAAAPRGPLWYLAQPGAKQIGPVSLEEILALVRSGKASASDLAWREGMPVWLPVEQTAELAPALLAAVGSAARNSQAAAGGGTVPAGSVKPGGSERWQTDATLPAPANTPFSARGGTFQAASGENGPSDWELSDVTRFLRSPSFFRWFGRGAGILAGLVALFSLIRLPDNRSWFDGALLLSAIFFAGEAVGSLLERLDKLAGKPPRP